MSLFDGLVRTGLPLVPKRVLWSVARRYVAGAELDEALAALRTFGQRGFGTILDVLGEDVQDTAEAEAAADEYHRALAALPEVDAGCIVSVKPTHLGLRHDESLCERLLDRLCVEAAEQGRFVRFEMEDAPTIDATLSVFRRVRARHDNVGCVLQSRLFRSADDAARLLEACPELNVRVVKGIYEEPAEIAATEPAEISERYLALTAQLLDGGAFVGLATHDDVMAERLLAMLAERGLDQGPPRQRGYEFQVLMGVRVPLAEAWLDAGHPVRVYVPYGRDWHAYSMRRLTRNPQIARHIVRAMFRRGG